MGPQYRFITQFDPHCNRSFSEWILKGSTLKREDLGSLTGVLGGPGSPIGFLAIRAECFIAQYRGVPSANFGLNFDALVVVAVDGRVLHIVVSIFHPFGQLTSNQQGHGKLVPSTLPMSSEIA